MSGATIRATGRASRGAALSAVALATFAGACSFDFQRLRRCREDQPLESRIAADCSIPTTPDVEGPDSEAPDGPRPDRVDLDAADVAVPPDQSDVQSEPEAATPPDRCLTDGGAVEALDAGTRVGEGRADVPGSLIGRAVLISGTTAGGTSHLSPSMACGRVDPGAPAPDRIYRYVVERGPTLLASTEAPLCVTRFDTIVSVRSDCTDLNAMGATTELGCNDDAFHLDHPACEAFAMTGPDAGPDAASDAARTDARTDARADVLQDVLNDVPDEDLPDSAKYTSAVLVGNLRAGDVVYVAVDGYNSGAGAFQLQIVENPVGIARLPAGADGAARCMCPPASTSTQMLTIPLGSANATSSVPLLTTSSALQEIFPLTTSRQVVGLSARLKLTSNSLAGGCAPNAIFDVLLAGRIVHSFEVTAQSPVVNAATGGVFTIPMQTFANVSVPANTRVPLSIRLRSELPAACGAMVFDAASPENEVTLLVLN